MAATAVDLSAIKTNALAAAPTFLLTVVESTDDLPHAANGATITVRGDYGGVFAFDSSDLSAEVTADPDQGLYVPSPSDASGASGAWIRQVIDRNYYANWWLKGDTSLIQDAVNRALKTIPDHSHMHIEGGDYGLGRAAVGSVLPGSSSLYNGITGSIYLDKPVRLSGGGYGTYLNGGGAALNCIVARASHCKISNLRCGNVAGQLITNESAGISFEPSKFVQGSGVGVDIEDCQIDDVWVQDADTGITGHPERDLGNGETKLWRASKLRVKNARLTNIRRQGVELFQCDDSIVETSEFTGGYKGDYVFSRFVRIIGSRNVKVVNNLKVRGFSKSDTGYIGVAIETAAFYGYVPHYEMCADVLIEGNAFENFGLGVDLIESQGSVTIRGNKFPNDHSSDGNFAIRIYSNGIRDPDGEAADQNNKMYVERVVITGNEAIGQRNFLMLQGTVLHGIMHDNVFFSNDAASANFVTVDLPGSHPYERVHYFEIVDNRALCNTAPTVGTINVLSLHQDDVIYIDGNKLTPTASGIIVHDGNGTLSAENPYSNTELPNGLWASYFDPARGRLFTGN